MSHLARQRFTIISRILLLPKYLDTQVHYLFVAFGLSSHDHDHDPSGERGKSQTGQDRAQKIAIWLHKVQIPASQMRRGASHVWKLQPFEDGLLVVCRWDLKGERSPVTLALVTTHRQRQHRVDNEPYARARGRHAELPKMAG